MLTEFDWSEIDLFIQFDLLIPNTMLITHSLKLIASIHFALFGTLDWLEFQNQSSSPNWNILEIFLKALFVTHSEIL